MVVADGRRVAEACSGPIRSELLRLCDETEILTNQLSDLITKGQGNSPQAKAIARHLSEKLQALKGKIQDALVSQVREICQVSTYKYYISNTCFIRQTWENSIFKAYLNFCVLILPLSGLIQ